MATVIVQQPGCIVNQGRQWSTGLCDVCDDMTVCCIGTLFPPCLGYYLAVGYGENCCIACLPGGMVALRTHMRLSYGIQGTICGDILSIGCCGVCEYCRMAREMRRHRI